MHTTLHKIITEDGLTLDGVLYEPDTPTTHVLVHVHGMGGNFYGNNFVSAVARALTEKGIGVFAFNNRGSEYIKQLRQTTSEGSSTRLFGSAYERFEDSVHDIRAALKFVRGLGYTTTHLSGHSLGCAKVVYYFNTTRDSNLASLLLLSPSDMIGLARANKEKHECSLTQAHEYVAGGRGECLLDQWVWGEYPISAKTYLSLFGDTAETGIFNFFDANDALEKLSTISLPVLAIMGRKDDALTTSIESMFDRMKVALSNSLEVRTIILGDATHGYWGDEELLVHEIVNWTESLLQGRTL